MDLSIKVKYQSFYGRDRFEPISNDAVFLTKITGKKTLSKDQLKMCHELGCKIIIENVSIESFID